MTFCFVLVKWLNLPRTFAVYHEKSFVPTFLKVYIDHLFDNLESGKRNYCFGKSLEKALNFGSKYLYKPCGMWYNTKVWVSPRDQMSYENETKSGGLWLTTIPMLCFSCAETSSTASSSTRFMNGSNPLSTPVTCRLPFSFTERNQCYCYILPYLDSHFNNHSPQGLPGQDQFFIPSLQDSTILHNVSILLSIALHFSLCFIRAN